MRRDGKRSHPRRQILYFGFYYQSMTRKKKSQTVILFYHALKDKNKTNKNHEAYFNTQIYFKIRNASRIRVSSLHGGGGPR